MKQLILITLLVTLTSCLNQGGSSGKGGSVTCSTDTELVKDTWLNTSNNDVYDLSTCPAGNTCNICFLHSCGLTHDDFSFKYGQDYVESETFITNYKRRGSWTICGDTMTINWNDGDETILERVIE